MTEAAQPAAKTPSGVSTYAAAAAVAGSVFIGFTGFLATAALVWALSTTFALPDVLMLGLQGLAFLGFIALTVLTARHALGLERARSEGEAV